MIEKSQNIIMTQWETFSGISDILPFSIAKMVSNNLYLLKIFQPPEMPLTLMQSETR